MEKKSDYGNLQFEEQVTERRVGGLWGAVGTLIFVVAVLIGWNVVLLRSTQRTNAGLTRAFAAMDSLRTAQQADEQAAQQLDTRLTEISQIEGQIHGRASAGALARVADRVTVLEERATTSEARVYRLSLTVKDQGQRLTSIGDSLANLSRSAKRNPAQVSANEPSHPAVGAQMAER